MPKRNIGNMTCSPRIENKDKIPTCYNLKELKEIARRYNKFHDDKIKNISKKNKLELWKILIEKNYKNCNNNEFCWLKQNYMNLNSNINKYKGNFRPEKPNEWKNNPNKWLNTLDLLNVMNQYMDKHKDFKFIGVFPIDFEKKIDDVCVSEEMCNLNISDLRKEKINKLGFIFNLDEHWQSGSHWTSLYMNIDGKSKNYGAYYYDSNGMRPPREVISFIKKITKDLDKINNNTNFELVYNSVKHQKENTECGMFSLYFLDQSLNNVKFDKFINKKNLDDNYVFSYRNKFFTKV